MRVFNHIDVNLLNEHLYIEGDRVLRKDNDRVITSRSSLRVGGSRKMYGNRVKYAMFNQMEPPVNEQVILDDDGNYISIGDDSVYMLYAYAKHTKVGKPVWEKSKLQFTARWIDKSGIRTQKSFATLDEATSYQRMMVLSIWEEDLVAYNIVRRVLG